MGAYGCVCSTDEANRGIFWEKLDELRVDNPWLLMGDFNCILHDEKISQTALLSAPDYKDKS